MYGLPWVGHKERITAGLTVFSCSLWSVKEKIKKNWLESVCNKGELQNIFMRVQ